MAVPGVTLPNGQQMPMSQFASTWADQAVAGGNPYFQGPGSPQASPQGQADANASAARLQSQPSPQDLAAGEAFGASLMSPQGGYSPDSAYTSAFNASLGNQRQAIDNMLATSLAQLGQRRNAAAAVVAAIPGQVKGNFQAAEGKAKTVSGAANKATEAKTGHGSLGGSANEALYQSDYRQNEGAGLAAVPLLHAGVQANYDLGEAGLQQQHMAGIAAIDQQQAAFDAQMAGQTQQENFQAGQNDLNYRRGLAATAAQNAANPPLSFAQQQDLRGIDPTTGVPFSVEAKANGGSGLTPYQQAQQTYHADAAVAKATSMTVPQVQAITNSQPFQTFVANSAKFSSNPHGYADYDPVKMATDILKAGNTSLYNVLVASGALTPEQGVQAKNNAGK